MGLHRHLILLVVCLFGSARWAGAADGCAPPNRVVGWIVSVQGRVEVRADPGAPWGLARPDETLCSRAILQVGERSRARIALANAPVSLDENTTLHLVGGPELIRAAENEQPALIRLLQGALYVFSRAPHALTVGTPYVNAGIEGTEFLVRVEAGRAQVTVFEGVVAARNAYGEVRVGSGQSVVAEAGKAPLPIVVARPRDAVQWALHYPSVLPPLTDPKAAADLPEAVRQALLLAGRGELAQAFDRLDQVPEAERGASFHLHRAALLLSVGRVDEARRDIDRALLQDPAAGLAYALRTVIAVAQNEKAGAFADARRAVELSPRQAAPKIALSYAEQAHFELEAARDALLAAVEDEPKNALAWARLAELWLMLGYRDRAREAAETAAKLAPQLERTQTVLGFTALAEFRTRPAKAAFTRAIALNTADPLPRFGLGLARIRQGDLEEGRQDIEIAVGLDPASALLRSYLGKAYFEERTTNPLTYFKELVSDFPNQENKLAAEQFAIAKELDPNDPTPWLYDAIRKQSENRPVEALRDAETAIRLNENRAVYRSRELLDRDRAARGASLGRIYNDLGFQQLGINEAAKSLALDPANASAHRFLSDLYAYTPLQRREISRVSELLQAQLLQDININPVQPSLSETNLNVFARGGPARPGFNEFTPLFERNQVQLNLSGEVGSNDTYANEAVLSGLYNRFSASAGQFHYETDGFHTNTDLQYNIYTFFAQAAITPELNVQAEFRSRETKEGDLSLNFDPDQFRPNVTQDLSQNSGRFGLRFSPAPSSDVIASLVYTDRDVETRDMATVFLGLPRNLVNLRLPAVRNYNIHSKYKSFQAEAQYIFRQDYFNIVSGYSFYRVNIGRNTSIVERLVDPSSSQLPALASERGQQSLSRSLQPIYVLSDDLIEQNTLYFYANVNFPEDLIWIIGASYDDYKQEEVDVARLSPKLGLEWQISDGLRLRSAVFQVIKPALAANRTIQPTQVAGFNQFFDDISGTRSQGYGVGLDVRLAKTSFGGIEASWRNVKDYIPWDEDLYKGYLYWMPHPNWAISTAAQFDKFASQTASSTQPNQVQTLSIPLSVNHFHALGLFAGMSVTYVHQNLGRRQPSTFATGADDFIIVDVGLGYRFPKRRGWVSLEVKNLLDEKFSFQDENFRTFGEETVTSPYLPERTIIARLSIGF